MSMKSALGGGRAAVSKPLYGQVREMILGRIGRGEWGPGDSLPNEFILASQFDVSIGTIRRAIEGLEDSGIVVRKQGRGTYVSGQGAQALQNKFTIIRSLSGRPLQPAYKLLDMARRPATPAEAGRLGVETGAELIEVGQALSVAGRRIGVERSIIPAELLQGLEEHLTKGQHLYASFSDLGVLVARVEDRIRGVPASDEVAADLGISANVPVLLVERLAFALDAKPVESRRCHYVAADVSCVATT